MAELRTAVGTLISKQRELSSSYASPISAARSAPRSRPASSAGPQRRPPRFRRAPDSAPRPPSAAVGYLVQARLVPVPPERPDGDGEPLGQVHARLEQFGQAAHLGAADADGLIGGDLVDPGDGVWHRQSALPVRRLLEHRDPPVVPSTSTSSPSEMTIVASPTAVTVGTPYSRPTMAACDKVPPPSHTQAAILAKAGVQFGDVDSQTSTSPGLSRCSSSAVVQDHGPSRGPVPLERARRSAS